MSASSGSESSSTLSLDDIVLKAIEEDDVSEFYRLVSEIRKALEKEPKKTSEVMQGQVALLANEKRHVGPKVQTLALITTLVKTHGTQIWEILETSHAVDKVEKLLLDGLDADIKAVVLMHISNWLQLAPKDFQINTISAFKKLLQSFSPAESRSLSEMRPSDTSVCQSQRETESATANITSLSQHLTILLGRLQRLLNLQASNTLKHVIDIHDAYVCLSSWKQNVDSNGKSLRLIEDHPVAMYLKSAFHKIDSALEATESACSQDSLSGDILVKTQTLLDSVEELMVFADQVKESIRNAQGDSLEESIRKTLRSAESKLKIEPSSSDPPIHSHQEEDVKASHSRAKVVSRDTSEPVMSGFDNSKGREDHLDEKMRILQLYPQKYGSIDKCSHTEDLGALGLSTTSHRTVIDPKMITDTSWEDLEQQATDIVVRITSLEDDDPNKPFLQIELGQIRDVQFQLSNDPEYLDQAVSCTREAIQIVPVGTRLLREYSIMLATLLSARYKYKITEQLQPQMSEDLLDQIEQLSMVLTAIPDDDENLPTFQNLLAQMYFDRSLRAGDGQNLDFAAMFAKKALESTHKSDENRDRFETAYRKILMYQKTDQGMSISDAMELSHRQARTVARDVPSWVMSVFDDLRSLDHFKEKLKTVDSIGIGIKLFTAYLSSRDSAVIDCTIKTFENSIIHDDLSDDTRRAWRLRGLAKCFGQRYKFEGREEDLHQALGFAEQAKTLSPMDDVERKNILRDLAHLQESLYERTSQTEYRDEAFENHKEAVRLAQKEDSDEPEFIHSLSMALHDRSGLFNNLEDCEAAEEMLQQAITQASGDSEKQGCIMIEQANMLRTRYDKTSNLGDLERAIKTAMEAKSLLPEHHDAFPAVCYTVGTLHNVKFKRLERGEDLGEAITFTRRAVEMTPKNNTDRGTMVVGLALLLGKLYDLTGNIEELEKGIRLIRETISSLPAEHMSIPGMKRNLASLLRRRMGGISDLSKLITSPNLSTSASKLDDLNEAIECHEQTLKTYVKTDRECGNVFIILGGLLSFRAVMNNNRADMERAQDLFLEGVENAAAPPLIRVGAARAAILTPQITGGDFTEWKDRLARIALDVLPYACSLELSREDQQPAIEFTQGFAAEICALSIRLGNIEEALQRVEYGRGLSLGHLNDRKDDLAVLKDKHPDFARRYQELRHRALRQIDSKKLSESWESMMEDRRKAHSMMRECEKEIRRNPGFENFQQPPPLEELQNSAADGPIVIVNVTYDSSGAIILTTSHLEVLSLPGMTGDIPEIFQRVLGRYRSGVNASLDPGQNVEKDVGESHSTQLLTWLWRSCVLPVLARLQELGALPETSGDPPRVWWIGSGAASSLPFHAAGDFDEICRLKPGQEQDLGSLRLTCMDWVTSSYTPTVKALQYARARADKLKLAEKPSILVVAMPETPGQSNLTGVVEEKLAVQESATGFCAESPLEYPSAEKVLERLQGSSVVHFACHGMSDSANPDASHILLQRRDSTGKIVPDQLTVGAILDATNQSGSGSWLVYLSACSTAQVKAKNMRDENIHLASAFQVAGFAHAIGSLWSAEDSICVEVARLFYEELSKYSGEERKFAVAYALRKAVMSVRSQHYHDPTLWAPFIHFGA